jgi:hypothetical protein
MRTWDFVQVNARLLYEMSPDLPLVSYLILKLSYLPEYNIYCLPVSTSRNVGCALYLRTLESLQYFIGRYHRKCRYLLQLIFFNVATSM